MKGILTKLDVRNGVPINYYIQWLEGDAPPCNITKTLGQTHTISFTGKKICLHCKKQQKKLFQGYCYPCFISVPQTAECVIRPEKCQAHLGRGRDIQWEATYHNQPHIVYLAQTGNLKVGVTSQHNLPNRWIDQGACQSIVIATTPNRWVAGQIEVALKKVVSDRTSWQKMLKNTFELVDLNEKRDLIIQEIPSQFKPYIDQESAPLKWVYPIDQYPEKVKSRHLDRSPIITAILQGIKGQYLIFNDDTVLNIRKHEGCEVIWTISSMDTI